MSRHEPGIPFVPEISTYVVVGLNSILRSLESLSNQARILNKEFKECENSGEHQETIDSNPNQFNRKFSTIFMLSSSQPAIIQDILPQMVAAVSLMHPELPSTRLLKLPYSCRAQLCHALNLPRISVIGILDDAPNSSGFLEFVRKHVPEIEIPWMRESKNCSYLPVKINSMETLVPPSKKR